MEYHLGSGKEWEEVTRGQTINLSVVGRDPTYMYRCEDMEEVTSLMDKDTCPVWGPTTAKATGKIRIQKSNLSSYCEKILPR